VIGSPMFPDGRYRDENGDVRLIVPALDWDAFVNLAFDEIWPAGAQSPQVTRRLFDALDDLEAVAPLARQSALRRQRDLLLTAVGETVGDERDAAFAVVADRRGSGVTAGAQFETGLL
jgi:uncharacterized membrane protein